MTSFTPLSAYSSNIFQQNSVQKCMTIMCIIVTEEDLFKKHAKKGAFFCPFSILPHKCCPAVVQGTFKNDSKYHICPYNCNTRPGFRVEKKIWGSRALSSALLEVWGSRGGIHYFSENVSPIEGASYTGQECVFVYSKGLIFLCYSSLPP